MNVVFNNQNFNIYSAPRFRGVQESTANAYKNFYNTITDKANKNYMLEMEKIRDWFYKLACDYNTQGCMGEFTKLSKGLMEFLVSKKFYNVAGIICSILIKFNRETQNTKNVEDLAIRGIAIAKRADDMIHVAARANDVNVVLRQKEPGSDRHIKYLRVQKEAFEFICSHYNEDVIQHCSTNSREIAPLEHYEFSLFQTRLDIATYGIFNNPKEAKHEYELAKETYDNFRSQYSADVVAKIDKKMEVLEQKFKLFGM